MGEINENKAGRASIFYDGCRLSMRLHRTRPFCLEYLGYTYMHSCRFGGNKQSTMLSAEKQL